MRYHSRSNGVSPGEMEAVSQQQRYYPTQINDDDGVSGNFISEYGPAFFFCRGKFDK